VEQNMVDALSPHALSNLIGSIYDCALDPSRWDQTLIAVKDALDCRTAGLHLNDLRDGRFLINKSVGIEPEIQEQMQKHLPEVHAWLVRGLALLPSLDEPYLISRHIPQAEVEASPYYQECMKPYGMVDIMQYFLMHTPTRFSGLGFGRHGQYDVVGAREIELGGLLLPHLRRAVTISNVLDARTIERSRMVEALDALRCAVVLTNGSGRVMHANRAAEDMLRAGDPIQSVGGVLQATVPTAAAELRAAIALAAKDESQIGKTGLAIRLTDVTAPPMFAHVLPMAAGDLRTRLVPASIAAIFIGASPDEQDSAETMAAAFGLTPAETRVLASLLGGRTVAETATALGVAITTARTHLDNIFAKTGVSRQAELVRLASQIVPPANQPD
jgi:DNA-binding CsgD family transcriptional regulator/PAS domain-containing protein